MGRKRYTPEHIIRILREVEVIKNPRITEESVSYREVVYAGLEPATTCL